MPAAAASARSRVAGRFAGRRSVARLRGGDWDLVTLGMTLRYVAFILLSAQPEVVKRSDVMPWDPGRAETGLAGLYLSVAMSCFTPNSSRSGSIASSPCAAPAPLCARVL